MENREIKVVEMANGEIALEGIAKDQWGINTTFILFEDNYLLQLAF